MTVYEEFVEAIHNKEKIRKVIFKDSDWVAYANLEVCPTMKLIFHVCMTPSSYHCENGYRGNSTFRVKRVEDTDSDYIGYMPFEGLADILRKYHLEMVYDSEIIEIRPDVFDKIMQFANNVFMSVGIECFDTSGGLNIQDTTENKKKRLFKKEVKNKIRFRKKIF